MKGFLFVLGIVLFPFLSFAGKYSVSGEFRGEEREGFIYLYEEFGVVVEKLDSVNSKDGKFSFELDKNTPRGFYKVGVSPEKAIEFLWESEHPVEVNANLDSLPQSIECKGGTSIALYNSFLDYNNQITSLDQTRKSLYQLNIREPGKYTDQINQANLKIKQVQQDQTNFFLKVMNENSGLFFAKYIKLNMIADSLNKENYFDGIDFSDDELVRSSIIPARLNHFFNNYVERDINEWKKYGEQLLNEVVPTGVKSKQMIYLYLVEIFFRNNQLPYAKKVASDFLNEFPESKYAKEMYAMVPDVPIVGEKVPEINLEDTEGNLLPLSSLEGKIVLIDFWASWCGPCRRENPNVVRVYEKYKDQGFTVYSVSLDKSKSAWVNAIKTDNLIWPNHVSDLKYWKSEAAKSYQVRGIPATFLIDREGKLIAQNLRGYALENKLMEIFAIEEKTK